MNAVIKLLIIEKGKHIFFYSRKGKYSALLSSPYASISYFKMFKIIKLGNATTIFGYSWINVSRKKEF